MIYLDYMTFAKPIDEELFLNYLRRTCYDTFYPFQIFPKRGFRRIDFADITILYGGNGSGKSTALNVLAEKIGSNHDAVYNRSDFFEKYLEYVTVSFYDKSFEANEMLTSDGVFDSMLDMRNLNEGIDTMRQDKFDEYLHYKELNSFNARHNPQIASEYEEIRQNPLANLDKLRKRNMALSKTQSKYVRNTVPENVREKSNGESAFDYFVNKIDRDGIYLLDEPENSLSPMRQIELTKFLEDSVRFFNCQLVIATHSPFVLSIKGAKIYDLDENPVTIKKWTELENVRAYYDFFKSHESEF